MRIAFVLQEQEFLSFEYIAGALKKYVPEAEVKVFFDPLQFGETYVDVPRLARLLEIEDLVVDDLVKWKPDAIAFSVLTHMMPWSLRMSRKIKNAGIDAPVVFGGVHPTIVPERVVKNPEVDYACVGDGELMMVDFARSLGNGGVDPDIPGMVYQKPDGTIVNNPMAKLAGDLNDIATLDKDAVFAAAPFHARTGTYQTTAMRGCPYYCDFCSRSITNDIYKQVGKIVRRRGVDHLLDELEEAREKYNFKRIMFYDEIFTANPRWIKEFAPKYKERINLPYWIFSHPRCLTPELIDLLVESNCHSMTLGVQSVIPEVRDKIGRHHSNEELIELLEKLRKTPIEVMADNILQFPDQTLDEALIHADFYAQHKVEFANVYALQLWAGTKITERIHDNGEMDEAEYERIYNGIGCGTMTGTDTETTQVSTLIMLSGLLPSWAYRFLRKNDRWKFYLKFVNRAMIRFAYTEWQRIFHRKPPIRNNLHPFMFLLQGVWVGWRKLKYKLGGGKIYPDTPIAAPSPLQLAPVSSRPQPAPEPEAESIKAG